MTLSSKKCTPCEDPSVKPLSKTAAEELLREVPTWWIAEENGILRLKKGFQFEDFAEAMKFVNRVAEIAESEGHHPNINIHDWNKVGLELYTHFIKGVHENDFILAAKIDQIDQIN